MFKRKQCFTRGSQKLPWPWTRSPADSGVVGVSTCGTSCRNFKSYAGKNVLFVPKNSVGMDSMIKGWITLEQNSVARHPGAEASGSLLV